MKLFYKLSGIYSVLPSFITHLWGGRGDCGMRLYFLKTKMLTSCSKNITLNSRSNIPIVTMRVPSKFNFLIKDQLTKKKDRILTKNLISNKWKYTDKKARLILQSGIYNLLTNILEGTAWRRKALPSEILVKRLYIPDCKISLAFLSYVFLALYEEEWTFWSQCQRL